MKFFLDLLPVVLFFVAFKVYDIYVATAVAMAAAAAQVGWTWLRHRRVERLPLITLGLILVLGGATLALQDETFIKWKPTVVNWLFAAVFLGSHFIGRTPMVQRMLGASMELPAPVWVRLNQAWVTFFAGMGLANLGAAYGFDTETWVNFKLFGMMGLTLLFVLGQGLYLARRLEAEPTTED